MSGCGLFQEALNIPCKKSMKNLQWTENLEEIIYYDDLVDGVSMRRVFFHQNSINLNDNPSFQ